MANPQQLGILESGIPAWNAWRLENVGLTHALDSRARVQGWRPNATRRFELIPG